MAEVVQPAISDISQRSERTLRFLPSLFCGAVAGLTVDLTLYPIDTIKTRLQGLGVTPGSALFFATYEGTKRVLLPVCQGDRGAIWMEHCVHAFAASLGEVAACSVRVPTEIVKQRTQAMPHKTAGYIAKRIYAANGVRGFYRGYNSTLLREIPFSFIQFPLWEALKSWVANEFPSTSKTSDQTRNLCTPLQGALCGSVSGGVAAAVTTPLDVIKTRIMLDRSAKEMGIRNAFATVYSEKGLSTFFAGIVPRTIWMSLGGLIFFGAFECAADFHRNWKHAENASLKQKYRDWRLQTFPEADGPWDILLTVGPHMLINLFTGWMPDNESHLTFEDARKLAEKKQLSADTDPNR